jgi:membrane-associated phospholipid phosphatase
MDDLGRWGLWAVLGAGYLAPVALLLITAHWLRARPTYLAFYLLGFAANLLLNVLLKLATREPRPVVRQTHYLAAQYDLLPLDWDYYGMPSGHVQSCLYSWAWLAFALPLHTTVPVVWATWLSLLCAWQRYATRQHSALQLLAGAGLGWLVGLATFRLAQQRLKEPRMDGPREDGSAVRDRV